jgi:hypothetical protein
MHDLPSKSNCIPNKEIGSLGIAVIVTPAVALLAGGSATAAGTGGSSRQLVKTQEIKTFGGALCTELILVENYEPVMRADRHAFWLGQSSPRPRRGGIL